MLRWMLSEHNLSITVEYDSEEKQSIWTLPLILRRGMKAPSPDRSLDYPKMSPSDDTPAVLMPGEQHLFPHHSGLNSFTSVPHSASRQLTVATGTVIKVLCITQILWATSPDLVRTGSDRGIISTSCAYESNISKDITCSRNVYRAYYIWWVSGVQPQNLCKVVAFDLSTSLLKSGPSYWFKWLGLYLHIVKWTHRKALEQNDAMRSRCILHPLPGSSNQLCIYV